MNETPSLAGSLNRADLKALGLNALKIAAGAAGTYLLQSASGCDFGEWKVLAVPLIAGLLDMLHKWLAGPILPPGKTP